MSGFVTIIGLKNTPIPAAALDPTGASPHRRSRDDNDNYFGDAGGYSIQCLAISGMSISAHWPMVLHGGCYAMICNSGICSHP